MIAGAATTDGAIAKTATTPAANVPTFFNPVEWRFINAAVGRLIPSDGPGPGGLETGVPEFIDR
jgi:gluconate 2-dehydrogenase gamma chain